MSNYTNLVNQVQGIAKSGANGLDVLVLVTERNALPSVHLPTYELVKDEDGGHLVTTPRVDHVFTPVSAIAKSGANGLDVGMFSSEGDQVGLSMFGTDLNLHAPGIVTLIGDDRGNVRSNQVHRGGIS